MPHNPKQTVRAIFKYLTTGKFTVLFLVFYLSYDAQKYPRHKKKV